MQADTFFIKLCQEEEYSNSSLREDCLNLLMEFPYLAVHMNYEVFAPSRVTYGIFRAMRSIGKAGGAKIAHSELWGECYGIENPTDEDFATASVSGDAMAKAISQLVGVGDDADIDFKWKYGYCVLAWRVENDIVH